MRYLLRLLLLGVSTLALMFLVSCFLFLVFCFVYWIVEGDWRQVEAEVSSSKIERVRPGRPQWGIVVSYNYRVERQAYKNQNLVVFYDDSYDATKAELTKWPAGRKFSIYYDTAGPHSISLSSDGGRQAAAAVASLLTPLALVILAFPILWRRRSRKKIP